MTRNLQTITARGTRKKRMIGGSTARGGGGGPPFLLPLLSILLLLFAAVADADPWDTPDYDCTCVPTYNTTHTTFVGSCFSKSNFVDPDAATQKCWCGRYIACADPANEPAPYIVKSGMAGAEFCLKVNATDTSSHNSVFASTCVINATRGPFDACGDGGSEVVNSTFRQLSKNFTLNSACALVEKRRVCDACGSVSDPDARLTWRDDDASIAGRCEILDTASSPYIRYDAACVHDGAGLGPLIDPSHGFYTCGPVTVPCTNQSGVNATVFTRVNVRRDSGPQNIGCTDFEEWDYLYYDSDIADIEEDAPLQKNSTHLKCSGDGAGTKAYQWDEEREINGDSCITTFLELHHNDTAGPSCDGQNPFDCKLSDGVEQPCSASSCTGFSSKLRQVKRPMLKSGKHGVSGSVCAEQLYTWQVCNTGCGEWCDPVPTGGMPAGIWSSWSDCEIAGPLKCSSDVDIAYGRRSRYRNLLTSNGTSCPDVEQDFQSCYPSGCDKPDDGRFDEKISMGLVAGVGSVVGLAIYATAW